MLVFVFYLEKVAKWVKFDAQSHIIEIGPGTGQITRALLNLNVPSLMAIEQDERMKQALEPLKSARFDFRIEDALQSDYFQHIPYSKYGSFVIVSNLPFHLAGPFIGMWAKECLYQRHIFTYPTTLVLICQKEMGLKLVKETDKRPKLSVLTQAAFHVKALELLDSRCFTPVPKTDAMVLELLPRSRLFETSDQVSCFLKLLDFIYVKPNKMIRSAKFPDWEQHLGRVGVDPTTRHFALTLEEWSRLTRYCLANHLVP